MGNAPSRVGGGSVRRVIVETTLAPGPAQVSAGSDPAAFAVGAQPDKIYVHAALVAVTDSEQHVATDGPDMGCSVGRFEGQAASRARAVEWKIRTMLGLGDHRPPHLAWDRLIECLASDGIVVTEVELMALPLAINFDSQLARELDE
jgi:hypothetical protein